MVAHEIGHRTGHLLADARMLTICRGYSALAIATETDSQSIEVETGLGSERDKSMLAFTIATLVFHQNCTDRVVPIE